VIGPVLAPRDPVLLRRGSVFAARFGSPRAVAGPVLHRAVKDRFARRRVRSSSRAVTGPVRTPRGPVIIPRGDRLGSSSRAVADPVSRRAVRLSSRAVTGPVPHPAR
jgi:hypothetical protein